MDILPVVRDVDEIVYHLTLAQGNLHLAAERLHMTPESVVAAVASDSRAGKLLIEQARVSSTLQLLDLLNKMTLILSNDLSTLQGKDLVNLFKVSLNTLLTLTNPVQVPSSSPLEERERLIKLLPPDIRRALMTMVDVGGGGGESNTGRSTG